MTVALDQKAYIYHLRNAQLAALDDLQSEILADHEKPIKDEPASFTNLAFDSGVLWERNRILNLIEKAKHG